MKKIIIGLVALTSISAFANCEVTKLRLGFDGQVSTEVLTALEDKGYVISPTYISPYEPYMENSELEEGYEIFIGEQEEIGIGTLRPRVEGNKVQNLVASIGDHVEMLGNSRDRSSIVRKLKHTSNAPRTYQATQWIGKTKSSLKVLSRSKPEKTLSWGLKNLPNCEEAQSLKL
jgi:hypothetical protein